MGNGHGTVWYSEELLAGCGQRGLILCEGLSSQKAHDSPLLCNSRCGFFTGH